MKTLFLIFLFCFSLKSFSQEITHSYKYDEQDVYDAFRMLGVENFKYELPIEFKGYYFDVIIKEFYEGKEVSVVQQSKLYEKMKRVLQWQPQLEKCALKIQTRRNDTVETFNIRLPGIGLRDVPLKLKNTRSFYGWESIIRDTTKITLDTEIPFLAFASTPVNPNRPNVAVYCELPYNNYRDWYSNKKVEHFFVFILKVSETL